MINNDHVDSYWHFEDTWALGVCLHAMLTGRMVKISFFPLENLHSSTYSLEATATKGPHSGKHTKFNRRLLCMRSYPNPQVDSSNSRINSTGSINKSN